MAKFMAHQGLGPALQVRRHRPQALHRRPPAAGRQEHPRARRARQDQRLPRGAGGEASNEIPVLPRLLGRGHRQGLRHLHARRSWRSWASSSSSSTTGTAAAPPATSACASWTRSPSPPATSPSRSSQGDEDLCVICNACYTTLAKTNRYMAEEPRGVRGRQRRPGRRGPQLRRQQVRPPHHGHPHQRHRPRGARRPGRAPPHGPQGRLLLRLPVLAPHGRVRRRRVPRRPWTGFFETLGAEYRRLRRQDQVLRRHDDADQRGRRAAPVPRAAQGRQAEPAPTSSSAPARSAR